MSKGFLRLISCMVAAVLLCVMTGAPGLSQALQAGQAPSAENAEAAGVEAPDPEAEGEAPAEGELPVEAPEGEALSYESIGLAVDVIDAGAAAVPEGAEEVPGAAADAPEAQAGAPAQAPEEPAPAAQTNAAPAVEAEGEAQPAAHDSSHVEKTADPIEMPQTEQEIVVEDAEIITEAEYPEEGEDTGEAEAEALPEEPVEEADAFEPGYVFVSADAQVYSDPQSGLQLGWFNEDAVVYASAADPEMLHIWFDTPEERQSQAGVTKAWVYRDQTRALTDQELEMLADYLSKDSSVRQIDGVALPCIVAYERMPEKPEMSLAAATAGLGAASHTPQEIQAFVNKYPAYRYQENLYRQAASKQPYDSGRLSQVNLQSALNLLSQVRYIAGIDSGLSLSQDYEDAVAAVSMVCALNGELSHNPPRPSVLSGTAYNALMSLASKGGQSSNLAYSWRASATDSILSYMSDSDSHNIHDVGHRRWLLNPPLKRVAFGAHGDYSATYVLDRSGSGSQAGVAWPAREMPLQYFSASDPWSVSLGRNVSASDITVTLVRQSDGRTWRFSSGSADGHFSVGSSGMGAAGCVVFRPSGLGSLSDGDTFQVAVTDAARGETLGYTVHFFSLDLSKAEPLSSPVLTDAVRDQAVTLTWTGVKGATGYYVCRSDAYHDFGIIADVPAGVLSYTDADVQDDWDYTYRVYAHSASVTSRTSSDAEAFLAASGTGEAGAAIAYPRSYAMSEGQKAVLNVSCTPASSLNYIRFRSSDPGVAEVDAVTGEITAKWNGSCLITAYLGDMEASCQLTVKEIPITDIISFAYPDAEEYVVDEWYRPELLYYPTGASMHLDFESSDPGVADVDPLDGWLNPLSPGTATITATSPQGAKASVTVSVRAVSHPLTLSMEPGEQFVPEDSVRGISFTTSDADVVSVARDGTLTAVGSGTATVTGKRSGRTVVLCRVGVASSLMPAMLEINRGEQYAPSDSGGSLEFTSSNKSVASVDASSGVITAAAEGEAVITATSRSSGSVVAKCAVTVVEPDVTHLKYVPEYVLYEGESVEWDIIAVPESMKRIKFLSWDPDIAAIDMRTGKITAVSEGEATVVALIESYYELVTCRVVVKSLVPKDQRVKAIHLDPEGPLELGVGESLQIAATLEPTTATSALTWTSSNPMVVGVDESGRLTCVGAGRATVSVSTANGIANAVSVTVENLNDPEAVTLSPSGTLRLNVGESLLLSAAFTPEKAVTALSWRSYDERVAVVSGEGAVTAVGEGGALISVTAENGVSDSVTVQVTDPSKPTGITVSPSGTVSLKLGDTLQLEAALKPAQAVSGIAWRTSSAKIATVSSQGLVTPVKAGTVTITATTDNGKTATMKVTVVDPSLPTGVRLSHTGTVALDLGERVTLKATLLPSTAVSGLTWTSSDPAVATVSQTGVVTPVKAGMATITATTRNNKIASVKVEVVDPTKPTGIAIRQGASAALQAGQKLSLRVSLMPATAKSTLRWASSNVNVASVSASGIVTAKMPGTARISVTTDNGRKAIITITVRP